MMMAKPNNKRLRCFTLESTSLVFRVTKSVGAEKAVVFCMQWVGSCVQNHSRVGVACTHTQHRLRVIPFCIAIFCLT
eukprot:6485863-Amphidinium_carterae.1